MISHPLFAEPHNLR